MNTDDLDAQFYIGLALLGLENKYEALQQLIAAILVDKGLSKSLEKCLRQDDTACVLQLLDIDDAHATIQKNMARGYQHWKDRIQLLD